MQEIKDELKSSYPGNITPKRNAKGNANARDIIYRYSFVMSLHWYKTDVKATAIQKLIYLQMVGYDMQWASFHVIEVMSQPWYTLIALMAMTMMSLTMTD
jgi:hypothetical protein